jgi:hypothetical protein
VDESALHEKPAEFFEGFVASPGFCDAQSVIPVDDHYSCHCSCGAWDVEAPTREEGLELARAHTRATAEQA